MNQYKMCMGMWIFLFSLIHSNIAQVQQKDKKNQPKSMGDKHSKLSSDPTHLEPD